MQGEHAEMLEENFQQQITTLANEFCTETYDLRRILFLEYLADSLVYGQPYMVPTLNSR